MKYFLNRPDNWGQAPQVAAFSAETNTNRARIEAKIAELKAAMEAKAKK